MTSQLKRLCRFGIDMDSPAVSTVSLLSPNFDQIPVSPKLDNSNIRSTTLNGELL